MKNLWVVGIVLTWVIVSIIGALSWECMADMYQGIILSLGITIAIYCLSQFSRKNNEYDEYGNYKAV